MAAATTRTGLVMERSVPHAGRLAGIAGRLAGIAGRPTGIAGRLAGIAGPAAGQHHARGPQPERGGMRSSCRGNTTRTAEAHPGESVGSRRSAPRCDQRRPTARATATASARVETPSLRYRLRTCDLTVLRVSNLSEDTTLEQ